MIPLSRLLLVLFYILLLVSCKKNTHNGLDVHQGQGSVLFLGDPAVDGCGWVIEIGDITYSPVNINSAFQQDSLEVHVEFHKLDSYWNCGWQSSGYQKIKIINMSLL